MMHLKWRDKNKGAIFKQNARCSAKLSFQHKAEIKILPVTQKQRMCSGNLPDRKGSRGSSHGSKSLLISSREIIRRLNLPGEERIWVNVNTVAL